MRDLALILNRKRERRGSIDFDLPEPVIEFDEFGLMKSITRSERNIAHRLIEEFMLSANECVAHYLENKRIASLYRIHEKPDAKRVYDFEVIAATFGYSLGVGALPIERMQMKTDRRAAHGTGKRVREIEIPKEVHITPRMYQKLAEKIAGKPEERILSFLMLRSLKQARYSEENLGHFALAATTYTHFTSPIRRYAQLAGFQHGGVLIGMVLVGLLGTLIHGEKTAYMKRCTLFGCVASAVGLIGLAAAGFMPHAWPLRPTVFLLGFANGTFAVSALGLMMSYAGASRKSGEGIRVGVWGAAQAAAFSIGGFAGATGLDVMRHMVEFENHGIRDDFRRGSTVLPRCGHGCHAARPR